MRKTEQAFQIALKTLRENPDIPDITLRTRIREQTPCSRTTAYKALRRAKNRIAGASEAKEVEIIAPPPEAKEAIIEPVEKHVEEILEEVKPTEVIEKPIRVKGVLLPKMLERAHIFFLHDILEEFDLEVSEKEARELGDMLHDVLENRVGAETLAKYDIQILAACYIGLALKIGAKLWKRTRKKKEKLKVKTKQETKKPEESLKKS